MRTILTFWKSPSIWAAWIIGLSSFAELSAQNPSEYYKIKVIDEESGRGVPMVKLETSSHIAYYTDNNGIIAYYEPGMMNEEVYFTISSPGYEYPGTMFGGKAFVVKGGDSAVVIIKRLNIAERLYRFTGEGMNHHSLKVGIPMSVKYPVINAQVTGLDASMAVSYQDKVFWTWGDTKKASGFLGHFAVSGAVSELPEQGGLDPDQGVDLEFFVDEEGFSKQMCPIPGPGMVWNHWMGILENEQGKEHLYLHYGRMKDLGEAYERGLAVYNDEREIFERVFQYPLETPFWPKGHYLQANVAGEAYHYFSFATPYMLRSPPDLAHFRDPRSFEAYTCLVAGSRFAGAESQVDRDAEGKIRYRWKNDTDPVGITEQEELIRHGLMEPEEAWIQLRDIETGQPIRPHTGSVYWNSYRQKWIMIFQAKELLPIGDVWYAEGDTPVGPWVYCWKVATHDQYNLYNPTQHPFFDKHGGRWIYFDGTFSILLAEAQFPVPRYEYNPLMYCLDLGDQRLFLPVPVYSLPDQEGGEQLLLRDSIEAHGLWDRVEAIPFYALPPDRAWEGAMAVFQDLRNSKLQRKKFRRALQKTGKEVLFLGLPIQGSHSVSNTTLAPLYEYRDEEGNYYYSVEPDRKDLMRQADPICLVWKNPSTTLTLDPLAKPVD